MGFYNDLDRAARDPYYRIGYESERQHERTMRQIAETRARGNADRATQTSSGSFTHSASQPSGGYEVSAGDVVTVLVSLAIGSLYAALIMGGFTLGNVVAAAILWFAVIQVVMTFWREIVGLLALGALLYTASLFF